MLGMSQRADVTSRVRLPRAHRQRPTRAGARPRGGSGQLFLFAVLAGAAAIVLLLAINQIGGATSSARVEREVVTADKGVVQSTVTGTGNVEPVTDDDVNFQTSGTLTQVYVKVGQHVTKGQLLATLDPTSAELTLKEAEAQLAADEDTLTSAEDGSSATSTATEATEEAEFVAYTPPSGTTTTATTTTGTTTTGTTTAAQTTTTTPTSTTTTTAAEPTTTTTSSAATPGTGASTASGATGGSSTSSSSSTSAASTAATIAADKVTVEKDKQAVTSDRTALAQTKLRAPEAGTIVSLESLSAGDSVSSGSDSSASSSSDSSGSDSTGSSTSAAASSSSASSSSSSSSTGFAEIASLHKLSMTVSFDESDISKLKVGQTATVTLEALTGVELAAKVTAISPLGTTSSSVVSYDATLTLEQQDARVKPGMSASAAVIVKQGQGVTVPNDAVTGTGSLGTVTEDVNGKSVSKQVVVGQRGDSRTVITSGLPAGTQLFVTTTLPSSTATTSSGSSASSGTLAGVSGSSGFGAAGGGFAGGGAGRGGPP